MANPDRTRPAPIDREPESGRSRPEDLGGIIPSSLDSRVDPLLRAAEGWRQALEPGRRVVDQVYLVPDVPSFLRAIAAWDERSFFPILIDDPAWSLPFLRAFRPARVVRFRPDPAETPGAAPASRPGASGGRGTPRDASRAEWIDALRAVSLAWTGDGIPDRELPPATRVPRQLGKAPPGIVLSHPGSPTLAAAVALAAGRFQPLVELEPVDRPPSGGRPGEKASTLGFADVLSQAEALVLARRVELLAEAVAGPSRRLADACDFLTLAGDWPYRYRNEVEGGPARGEHALDDLIGRVLQAEDGGVATSRSRWAFCGRIPGGPSAGVYRAMCALFLQPERAFLWNTYGGVGIWASYQMTDAAIRLEGCLAGPEPPVHRAGVEASLAAWHEALDPTSRFGLFLVNSSGSPRHFAIAGGPGRPSDLPRGAPAVVAFVHSFSAADPLDAQTLAGRWLENGAYIYYGSMNEPFLSAFRTPSLVAEFAAAGWPLSAALREGEAEPFGRPWRLVYLGDPLYTLRRPEEETGRPAERLPPGPWQPLRSGGRRLPGTPISPSPSTPPEDPRGDAPGRLETCDAETIRSLCRGGSRRPDRRARQADLLAIDRRKLSLPQRAVLDELTIDAMLHAGDEQRLLEHLLELSDAEASPRVQMVIETLLMGRLMAAAASGSFGSALDLWDRMINHRWPPGSPFPSDFTERLANLLGAAPAGTRGQYLERLKAAASGLRGRPEASALRELVAKELERLGEQAAPSGR
ncbi:MAG: hypothetical protein U0790_01340 [Isosphaeraceae bacterium]